MYIYLKKNSNPNTPKRKPTRERSNRRPALSLNTDHPRQPILHCHVGQPATCRLPIRHKPWQTSPQKRPCRAIRFKNSKQGREKRSRVRADRSRETLRIARSPALEGRKGEVVAPSGPKSLLSRRKPSSSSSASAPNPSPPPRAAVRSHSASPDLLPFWQQTWFLVLLLLMGLSFFALSLFLFLGLDLDGGSPTIVESAANDEGIEITYGSVVKLMHERTKFRLHSHDVPYGSGSGQQSVTGFPNVDDANSYWIVRPQPDSSDKQGDVIKSSSIIRFQHMRTRKWLHSHLHASPISGNLEVSCYGGDGVSDTGDYWRLEIEGSGKTWKQDQRVRLQHIDTGGYLHSHDKKYSRIAGGQQEVCGVREKRADNVWLATEGVYLPVNESK